MLNSPSEEQSKIVKYAKKYNIVVDAVAGSGKTTTVLHIGKTYPDKQILLLTYNAKLKLETRQKVSKLGLTNINVDSYHSFCVKNYYFKAYTDFGMKKIISENMEPRNEFSYDMIILDEVQDITILYYKIIKKLYFENKIKNSNLCVLGDKHQTIFGFNGADNRFLIYAEKCFNFNNISWKKCKLSESFRITIPMATFVNTCMLNENRLRSHKEGDPPKYIVCDIFSDPIHIVSKILRNNEPKNVFILAPSLKSAKTPVRQLENKIKLYMNIPIYVPVSDEETLDASVIQNKLVISTYHQVKGLERDHVVLFGFENSYFDYIGKDENPRLCPNIFYVGATRAKKSLTIFQSHKSPNFQFLNVFKTKKCTEYQTLQDIRYDVEYNNSDCKSSNKKVVDLVKFLNIDDLEICKKFYKVETILKKSKNISLKNIVVDNGNSESVAELNGIAIPLFYEYTKFQKIGILKFFKTNEEVDLLWDEEFVIDKIRNAVDNKTLTIDMTLNLANMYNSTMTGYIFKSCQIENYDWITEKQIQKCIKRLEKLHISENSIFEEPVQIYVGDYTIHGSIDCFDQDEIYEFKCVSELKIEHEIQLAIYLYMCMRNGKHVDAYLYNILTHELLQLSAKRSDLEKMMKYLLSRKDRINSLTDDEFLENIL